MWTSRGCNWSKEQEECLMIDTPGKVSTLDRKEGLAEF